MIRLTLQYLCLMACVLVMACSMGESLSGSGSSTGNARISGVVLNKQNTPASQTIVMLIPESYDPVSEGALPDSLCDTTNASGRYSIAINDSGNAYNIYAVNGQDNTEALLQHVVTDGDSVECAPFSLEDPGAVEIIFPDSIDTAGAYVYIPGTQAYCTVSDNARRVSGRLLLLMDMLPAVTFDGIYLAYLNRPGQSRVLTDRSITIQPNDTVIIGRSELGFLYTPSNSYMPSSATYAIGIDYDNSKWIGYYSNVLSRFDGNKWWNIDLYHMNIQSPVLCIVVDQKGYKWFGTHTGLMKFDGNQWYEYNRNNSGFPGGSVCAIDVDSKNNKWIAAYSVGLVKYNGTTWELIGRYKCGAPSDYINTLVVDNDDAVWIGTRNGIARYTDSTVEQYNSLNSPIPCDTILCSCIDSNGTKWFGTVHGELITLSGKTVNVYDRNNSLLPGEEVFTIAVDSRNNIWIGTDEGYLIVYKQGTWTAYTTLNSNIPSSTKAIYSIAVDKNDIKWVALYGCGLLSIGTGLLP